MPMPSASDPSTGSGRLWTGTTLKRRSLGLGYRLPVPTIIQHRVAVAHRKSPGGAFRVRADAAGSRPRYRPCDIEKLKAGAGASNWALRIC